MPLGEGNSSPPVFTVCSVHLDLVKIALLLANKPPKSFRGLASPFLTPSSLFCVLFGVLGKVSGLGRGKDQSLPLMFHSWARGCPAAFDGPCFFHPRKWGSRMETPPPSPRLLEQPAQAPLFLFITGFRERKGGRCWGLL